MGLLALFVLILAALGLPDLVPDALQPAGQVPDLWLLITVYLSLRATGFDAVRWAILLGLIRDCLSLDVLGTHAFVLGTVAFLSAEGGRNRGAVRGASRYLICFVMAALASWLYVLRVLPLGPPVGLGLSDAWGGVVSAMQSTVLALVLFPLLDRGKTLDDLCGRRRALSA